MKILIAFIISTLSFSSYAYVDSKNCPEKFTITYSEISRDDLSAAIEDSFSVKMAWDVFSYKKQTTQEFTISTRSDSSMCVYINGKVGALLQTNDGVDEINLSFDDNVNLYFRTKVLSFSRTHITLANDVDSRSVYAPIFVPNSDSVEFRGEVKVGSAKSVHIEL